MLSDVIILMHDNARLNTANLVSDKLERFGWERFNILYTAQIFPPCDFRFFGDLKKDIYGR